MRRRNKVYTEKTFDDRSPEGLSVIGHPAEGPSVTRVMVTGGAGFVGSHLCERLLDDGYAVLCVDDFSTGRRANIAHLSGRSGFRLIEHDVREPLDADADEIYNLACPASPTAYQADPVSTTMTSVLGAKNLLDLAARNKAKILQASTSEVYGDPEVHPQPEDYHGSVSPIGVRACYDEGKRCAETLFFDYARTRGVRIKVARIFNTYGPRMRLDDGRVVSNFIVQALSGEPLTVYGDGSQTRSFCYVEDLVDGLARLMASADAIQGPVNLGNPGELTIAELADLVTGMVGSRGPVEFRPLPQDDPRQRKPDISRAATLLGWRPTMALKDGLSRTIDYFAAQVDPRSRRQAAE